MTKPLDESTEIRSPFLTTDMAVFSISDRTKHIDRCIHLLANRRRRFCLYYLRQASGPLSIRDLALFVEISIAPATSSVSQQVLDQAVRELTETHLPKLRDAGLVNVQNDRVELESNPGFPVRDWLATVAAMEVTSSRTGVLRNRSTQAVRLADDAVSHGEEKIDYKNAPFGLST